MMCGRKRGRERRRSEKVDVKEDWKKNDFHSSASLLSH
jgi:hypothetical protein